MAETEVDDKKIIWTVRPQVLTAPVVTGTSTGFTVKSGQFTTVTASDTVVTGLTTVLSCVANLEDAPTTDPEVALANKGDQAGTPAAGSILITSWKTFGGTPAAATTFSKKVNWIAIGV